MGASCQLMLVLCMLQVPGTRSAGPEGGESGHKTWGPPAFEARRHVRNLGLGLGCAAAAAARFRRRQPPAATELLYVSDGDGNGVCRHLGTGYGRHSWVNPVLAGRVQARAASFLCLWQVNVIHMRRPVPRAHAEIQSDQPQTARSASSAQQSASLGSWSVHTACPCSAHALLYPTKQAQVTASSPGCRHTDTKALVSGSFLRQNAAGPPAGGGSRGAWWQLHIGPRHRLACNHYTLRHDASAAFARSWVLQARRPRPPPGPRGPPAHGHVGWDAQ